MVSRLSFEQERAARPITDWREAVVANVDVCVDEEIDRIREPLDRLVDVVGLFQPRLRLALDAAIGQALLDVREVVAITAFAACQAQRPSGDDDGWPARTNALLDAA